MLTLALALALSQPPATQPPAGTQPDTPRTQPLGTAPQQQPAEATFRVRSVLGARVSVQNNTSVGVIEDLVFDQDGQIEYALVADQGQLVTVPWQAVKFAALQANAPANAPLAATIAIPAEQYRAIPRYTVTTYPSFYTPTYRTEVYRYYGLTPRERRLVERRVR